MTTPRDIAIAIKDDPLPSRSGVAFANFVSNFSGTASAHPPTAAQVVLALRTDPDRQRAGEMLADFIAANGATNGVSGMIATEVVRAIRDDPQPERSGALLLSFVQTFGPAGEEGGGDTPAWLPAGAVAFADFSARHYYAGGAETTAAAFTVSDAVDGEVYDPADIVPGTGLVQGANGYIGGILQPVPTLPVTIVVEADFDRAFDLEFGVVAYDHDGYVTWMKAVCSPLSDGTVTTTATGQDGSNSAPAFSYAAARNRCAMTLRANGSLSISANGEAVHSATVDPGGSDFAALNWYIGGDPTTAARSVTVYPVQDDADLPALSALA